MSDLYHYYKDTLKTSKLPAAVLDLDKLDQNIEDIFDSVGSKKVRIATKSIRSTSVLRYLIQKKENQISGLMCFTVDEAFWLARQGFKDILIAYPYVNFNINEDDKHLLDLITFMVDAKEHINTLEKKSIELKSSIKICLDIDLSTKLGNVYFGVYRSSLKNLSKVKELVLDIKKCTYLKLTAVMGYEAQIAGVGDNNPFKKLLNLPIQVLKNKSISKIQKKREQIVHYIKEEGFELEFVNGGGTGSIRSTVQEPWVTEVAVGSGFYSPLLFDYYKDFKYEPSLFYALEVTRNPDINIYTCAGGGYVASGGVGEDKLPRPYLPQGIRLDKNEGVGEVQTPLFYSKKLEIGSPVFFRHAKAGELCERFNSITLIRDGQIQNEVKTYRGEEQCFL